MKHVLAAMAFLVGVGVMYAAFAFSAWQLDPSKWLTEVRALCCFLGLMVGFSACCFVEFET